MYRQSLASMVVALATPFLPASGHAQAQSASPPSAQRATDMPVVLDWTKGQPKELWRTQVGWGYSAAVARGSRLYTVGGRILLSGADRQGAVFVTPGSDKPLWQSKDLAPRAATPVYHDGFFYGPNQPARCLVCVDARDGSTHWSQKLDASRLALVGERLIVQCRTGYAAVAGAGDRIYTAGWSNSTLRPHVASPIFYKGYLYTPSGYLGDSSFACADPKDGTFQWTKKTHIEGLILAEGKIIAQGFSGMVFLADATPEGYVDRGSYQVSSVGEWWTAPSLSGGRLFVRSWEGELVGLDLSFPENSSEGNGASR